MLGKFFLNKLVEVNIRKKYSNEKIFFDKKTLLCHVKTNI